jgi:hypothetical protein
MKLYTTGGVRVSAADFVTLLYVALRFAVVEVDTPEVAMVKLPVVAPPEIVMVV